MRDKINQYIHFYRTPGARIVGWIFLILGLIGTIIIAYLFSGSGLDISEISFDDDALENGTALNYYLPYLLPGAMFAIFWLVGFLMVFIGYLKKQRMIHLLMHATPIEALVVRNIQNFHVQLNRIPRREVLFKAKDGNSYEYHFFDEYLAHLLKENTVVEIVTKGKKAYPSVAFFECVTSN